jgi:hypothetical protein
MGTWTIFRQNHLWLVVLTILKNIMENKKCLKPPTSRYIHIYILRESINYRALPPTQPGPTLQRPAKKPSNLRPKTCRCTRDRAGPWPSLSSMAARAPRGRVGPTGPPDSQQLNRNSDKEKFQVREIGCTAK